MKKILSIILTILFAFIYYYLFLPALNIHNITLYLFIIFIILFYYGISLIFNLKKVIPFDKRIIKLNYLLLAVPTILVLIMLWNFIESPLFMASKYANRIEVDSTKEFNTDIQEVDFSKLPLLDKTSSKALGDRVMGQMSDLVSQYDVSNIYTQINYNNKIIRVTPLEYASPIKWLTNRKEGVKGYITVDSTTGKSELIRLDKGMKYVESALFNDNVYRKLRFKYPTKNFGNISFEIDNEGNPYWIIPTIKYTAIGLKREIASVIILDPITGDSKEYKIGEVPSWVDHVYPADLIIEQVDDWGQYKDGFLNAIFGQKNVVQTTAGYNYMTMNDDVYLYTGITSVSTDESNIGFILTNMRTKETNFYAVPGAEEYSAMDSAKGQVQQMNYDSTFPLLINLNNRATYLLSLKDAAGLVKMYAFVDVADYQKVIITDSAKGIKTAADNYLNNVELGTNNQESITKTIKIESISQVSIDGTSYFYITDTEKQKYYVSIKANKNILPFIKKEDNVEITYNDVKEVIEITNINLK